MRTLILTFFIALFAAGCLPAQQMNPATDIQAYVLTFYAISDPVSSPAFVPGDTLTVQWVQPTGRSAYEQQPDPTFGNHTGVKFSVEVQNSRVHYESDSLAAVQQTIILPDGAYEMTVRAVDTHGKSSKESQPFKFLLVSGAPAVPVQVQVLIKRSP